MKFFEGFEDIAKIDRIPPLKLDGVEIRVGGPVRGDVSELRAVGEIGRLNVGRHPIVYLYNAKRLCQFEAGGEVKKTFGVVARFCNGAKAGRVCQVDVACGVVTLSPIAGIVFKQTVDAHLEKFADYYALKGAIVPPGVKVPKPRELKSYEVTLQKYRAVSGLVSASVKTPWNDGSSTTSYFDVFRVAKSLSFFDDGATVSICEWGEGHAMKIQGQLEETRGEAAAILMSCEGPK